MTGMLQFDFGTFFTIIFLMTLYGMVGGVSAIFSKKGILQIGGLKVDRSWRIFLTTLVKLVLNPLWLAGAILGVIGFGIYLIALYNFELSIVKPLVNTNLLFTFIFAYFIFKEHLTFFEWLGVICLIFGMIFLGIFTSDSSNTIEILPLLVLLPITVIGMVFLGIVIVTDRIQNLEFLYAFSAGIFYGLGAIFTKAVLISSALDISLFIFSIVMFIVTYIVAIVSQQFAFNSGRLSIVNPISNAISVIIPVLGAVFIFSEHLIFKFNGRYDFIFSFGKVYGLIFILFGIFLLKGKIIRFDETLDSERT